MTITPLEKYYVNYMSDIKKAPKVINFLDQIMRFQAHQKKAISPNIPRLI